MLVGNIDLAVPVHVLVDDHAGLGVNAFGCVSPEPGEGFARSHPDYVFAECLGCLGVVVNLLEGQLLEFVAVCGNVEVSGPFPVFPVNVDRTDCKLETPVGHFALIPVD